MVENVVVLLRISVSVVDENFPLTEVCKAMGFNMKGCERDLKEIIRSMGSHGEY